MSNVDEFTDASVLELDTLRSAQATSNPAASSAWTSKLLVTSSGSFGELLLTGTHCSQITGQLFGGRGVASCGRPMCEDAVGESRSSSAV